MGPEAGSEPEEDGDMGSLMAEDVRDLLRGQTQPQGEGPGSGVAAAQGPGQPRTEAEDKALLEPWQAPKAAPGVDEGRKSAGGRVDVSHQQSPFSGGILQSTGRLGPSPATAWPKPSPK